jgi:hypothetical protein
VVTESGIVKDPYNDFLVSALNTQSPIETKVYIRFSWEIFLGIIKFSA